MTPFHPEDNKRYGWNDIGAGNLFADVFKQQARYVPERKSWYCYDGMAWRPDTQGLGAMERCKKMADAAMIYALSIKDETKRSSYIEYVKKWQRRNIRETILKDASSVYPVRRYTP